MYMKQLLLLLSAGILACSCGTGIEQPGEEQGNQQQEETVDLEGFTRAALHGEITHVQPMTGIVLWNTSGSVTKSYVQLEFAYMLYNDVCKKKDVYDWTPVERLLDGAASRGHQVVMRFRYTYPGYSCAVPDYIKSWPGYEATNAKSEGRNTEFPDWRCEELQRFHLDFYRKLAEKYDSDPRLAFLETGFGLWAEYHIYDGPRVIGKTFPSKDFQTEFMQVMGESFKNTPWMFSIDAADNTYGPFRQHPELMKLNFGNFDDSFMCEEHDDYNFESWQFFGEERYKVGPLGGEFSYYTDSDQKHCLDKGGMHGRVFEDEVAKFHMTFIIGNDQPGKQTEARLTEAAMSMGYRFRIKDYYVKDGGGEAKVLISNVGVAPIYRSAYVSVNGNRGAYDLSKLMPGDERWVSVAGSGIGPSSAVRIECDHLVDGQKGIEFEADISKN